MNAAVEFIREKSIDRPVGFKPRFACKGCRHYLYPEMRLARAVKSGVVVYVRMMVPGVQMAFIDDFKPFRRKCNAQFFFHY